MLFCNMRQPLYYILGSLICQVFFKKIQSMRDIKMCKNYKPDYEEKSSKIAYFNTIALLITAIMGNPITSRILEYYDPSMYGYKSTIKEECVNEKCSVYTYIIESKSILDSGSLRIQQQILLCYKNDVIMTILCDGDFSSNYYVLEDYKVFRLVRPMASRYDDVCVDLYDELKKIFNPEEITVDIVAFCYIEEKKNGKESGNYYILQNEKLIKMNKAEADKKMYGLKYSDEDLFGANNKINIEKIISEFKERVKKNRRI